MKLDISVLKLVLGQLEQSVELCEGDLAKNDPILLLHLRTGAIKSFEYTYEISIKLLRRFLSEIESVDVIKQLTFRDLIRAATERGFIDDPEPWFTFREFRNITSHTYDDSQAEIVYAVLPRFIAKVHDFANRLEKL